MLNSVDYLKRKQIKNPRLGTVQGSFEAGGDVIKDNAEIYRIISKLLCSKDPEIQQVKPYISDFPLNVECLCHFE